MLESVDAHELVRIAREAGADVFRFALHNPSETGGWLVGDLDFCEYLDRYRDQQVLLIVAPLGQAPAAA